MKTNPNQNSQLVRTDQGVLLANENNNSTVLAEPPTLPAPAIIAGRAADDGSFRLVASKHSEGGRKIRRNGRVASLPKLQRDMVNHMLWNALPYKNIVAALDEAGFTVTERNVSNWSTGGYLEWSLAQEHVLHNRLDQDHMLDFLRRDDAPELPEVGLQAAATRLSQVLLQKLARAEDPEANLDNYGKLVDLLVRLNREIGVIQKQRDDSRRTLGREYDPVHVKEDEQISAIENERFFSNPPSDSTLSKPAVPPALPPIPTATIRARQAREEQQCAETARQEQNFRMFKAAFSTTAPGSKAKENPLSHPDVPRPHAPRSDAPPSPAPTHSPEAAR